MRWRLSTRYTLRTFGARLSDPPADVDRRVVDHLRANLDASPSVDRVVLLPLDGVYGEDGRLDEKRTSLMVPNDYVFEVAATHPKLVPACSINLYRADALAELDRCAARGAVLCKWLPAAMGFDPAHPRCAPFYARLKALGMPVLSHIGTELAVATVSKPCGEQARLGAALDSGATVIFPHAGGLRLFGDAADWRGLVEEMRRRPNLWLDDSALLMLHRRPRLHRLLETPEVHARVLHGSDFPLPAQPLAFADRIGLRKARAIRSIPGAFDRDIALKDALGVPREFLTRAAKVLRIR
jgi:predicted TIM-barrel fold metal-dependent hydrolase